MKMRQIKLMVLGVLAACALAAPVVASAAEPAPVITAAGIKVKPCEEKDTAPLLMFVRGVDCGKALDLANEASSSDDPCPFGWHGRRTALKALIHGKSSKGPSVFLCTQKSGQKAFTYKPIGG
jgi:hypothetical protein